MSQQNTINPERLTILRGEGDVLPELRPSKSQRKRDMDQLKSLGAELVDLTPGRLARLDLPTELRAAVDEARRLTSFAARKRQLLFIGRCLEQIETDGIREQIAAIDRGAALPKAPVAESSPTVILARSLLTLGDPAVFALSPSYGPAALQQLRQVVRKERKAHGDDPASASAVQAVVACLKALPQAH